MKNYPDQEVFYNNFHQSPEFVRISHLSGYISCISCFARLYKELKVQVLRLPVEKSKAGG